MPKSVAPNNRRCAALSYFLNSRTCHTLKDLEKTIPAAVSGVSSMQVKDQIQVLLDEDDIRVEKIGSGNWYWRFGAADLATLEADSEKLKAERQKLLSETETAKDEIEHIEAERVGAADNEADERIEILQSLSIINKEVIDLNRELAGYRNFEPALLQQMCLQASDSKEDAERWTEMIHSMTSWVKMNAGVGRQAFVDMQRSWFGEEWDEEEGGLKEM
jgi:Mnd1 HTH domain